MRIPIQGRYCRLMDQTCAWCERPFAPRHTTCYRTCYSLSLAGVDICWNCSDLWEEEIVRMHFDCIKGWMDLTKTQITTESGHVLPVKLGEWRKALIRKGYRADAVDLYGHNWRANLGKDHVVTLKPVVLHKV